MGILSVGDRLPPLELPSAQGGIVLQSQPRRNLALLLLPEDRAAWKDHWKRFRRAAPRLQEWYGRPLLVFTGAVEDLGDPGLTVAADPGRVLESRLAVEPGEAVLLVADRWGVIYHLSRGRSAEELPRMEDVEEWLKYLATQCPECGVPDEPGHGEWTHGGRSAGASA